MVFDADGADNVMADGVADAGALADDFG